MSIDNTTPEKGMFTVHFKNVGRLKATFDVHVTDLDDNKLRHAVRAKAPIRSGGITFGPPDLSDKSTIYADSHIIGTFRVTLPTPKGHPGEPT